tara:strand:- start:552 stop:662 length:111 start_codon:yes stop_codon:yes gene_type:complete
MAFQDKHFTKLIWTSGEQDFFAAKQFTNEPKRRKFA